MSVATATRPVIESVLRRDRAVVAACLTAIAALAWAWLFSIGGMAAPARWGIADFAVLFAMWAVMMVGMMVPAAAPMVLLFAAVNRRSREKGGPFAATGAFVAGYLAMWSGFSLGAVVLQWALQQAALLSPTMVSTSPALSGLLLIAAGIYQATPLKATCLEHCRTPMEFLSRSWRSGTGGAFVMGLHHGAYCVGCCWVLMALLFAAGVMNLVWVAAIAAVVLVEKLAPFGVATGRITAVLLVAAGAWIMI